MEITRKFNVADAIMLEFTGKVTEFLSEDLPKFTAFDPDLDDEKLTLLKGTYESALTFGTDKTQVGVVKQLTENMSGEFKNCISIFKSVRYFAKKKFGSSPAILTQFGLDNYSKARQSQPDMVLFMYDLAKAAEKYKTELTAAGLKETVISSIKPAALSLENSNTTQETGKNDRSGKTEERIILLNSLYKILEEFNDASKIVFADNALKRARYIIPYNKGGDNGTDKK